MSDNSISSVKPAEESKPEKPRSQIIIIIQNIFVFSIKIVVYQVVVRSVVLGVSIGIMHFIEKTAEILIDSFLDALVGPIGTKLGEACVTVLFKIPRIVLERTRDLLDMVFDNFQLI